MPDTEDDETPLIPEKILAEPVWRSEAEYHEAKVRRIWLRVDAMQAARKLYAEILTLLQEGQ
jgi:hypothetical protein